MMNILSQIFNELHNFIHHPFGGASVILNGKYIIHLCIVVYEVC